MVDPTLLFEKVATFFIGLKQYKPVCIKICCVVHVLRANEILKI